MPKTRIAIIGGGCAGLSAAIALAKQGWSVSLYEAGSELGGRARSVALTNASGSTYLDNGQHILIGAYKSTLQLLNTVGLSEKQAFLRLPFSVRMQGPGHCLLSLNTASYLPAALAMPLGLLACQGLSFRERLAAIGMMMRMAFKGYRLDHDLPLASFLQGQNQSAKAIQLLWEPISLAALNTPIQAASTQVFLNVLKDTMASSAWFSLKKSSDFLLAKQDLSKLIGDPASAYLRQHGVRIKPKHRITGISKIDSGFHLSGAEEAAVYSHVVLATAPHNASQLMGGLSELHAERMALATFNYQPIVTVYLQYPTHTKLRLPMIGLTNGLGQWVFDRGQLCQQHGLLAVVISGTGSHQDLSQAQLAEAVTAQLKQAFPELSSPLWHKVIAEKRATYACTPDLTRPPQQTALPNFFLAGDYCYADYPATIEGAVRSGLICAELIQTSHKVS
ncbi:COG2907 Predicted NAD/FAD-binding protein [Methylophilaceae bacterium]|jgi:squalene-associated FAD-dependent desaturase